MLTTNHLTIGLRRSALKLPKYNCLPQGFRQSKFNLHKGFHNKQAYCITNFSQTRFWFSSNHSHKPESNNSEQKELKYDEKLLQKKEQLITDFDEIGNSVSKPEEKVEKYLALYDNEIRRMELTGLELHWNFSTLGRLSEAIFQLEEEMYPNLHEIYNDLRFVILYANVIQLYQLVNSLPDFVSDDIIKSISLLIEYLQKHDSDIPFLLFFIVNKIENFFISSILRLSFMSIEKLNSRKNSDILLQNVDQIPWIINNFAYLFKKNKQEKLHPILKKYYEAYCKNITQKHIVDHIDRHNTPPYIGPIILMLEPFIQSNFKDKEIFDRLIDDLEHEALDTVSQLPLHEMSQRIKAKENKMLIWLVYIVFNNCFRGILADLYHFKQYQLEALIKRVITLIQERCGDNLDANQISKLIFIHIKLWPSQNEVVYLYISRLTKLLKEDNYDTNNPDFLSVISAILVESEKQDRINMPQLQHLVQQFVRISKLMESKMKLKVYKYKFKIHKALIVSHFKIEDKCFLQQAFDEAIQLVPYIPVSALGDLAQANNYFKKFGMDFKVEDEIRRRSKKPNQNKEDEDALKLLRYWFKIEDQN